MEIKCKFPFRGGGFCFIREKSPLIINQGGAFSFFYMCEYLKHAKTWESHLLEQKETLIYP